MSVDFRAAIFDQPHNLAAAADAFESAVSDGDVRALCDGTIVLSGKIGRAHV